MGYVKNNNHTIILYINQRKDNMVVREQFGIVCQQISVSTTLRQELC